MTIYPALLSDSLLELQAQLDAVQQHKAITTVQIDIIDGYFADNLTVTPSDLPDLEFGRLECDLHLMVIDPLDFVHELVPRHDEIPIRAVIAQVEKMHRQPHFLEEVQKQGWQPGLSLDAYTPVEAIDDEAWSYLAVMQLMGIQAGFQGQSFMPAVLEKIPELRREIAARELEGVEIMLDGGINLETVAQVRGANIDSIVVGSALWKSASISETIDLFVNS